MTPAKIKGIVRADPLDNLRRVSILKGFGIYVKNDLLEPKHYQHMGEAIWLYLWLLDKLTSVNESGTGKVLGGRPITTEDIQVELGLPVRTYRRYTARLKKHGYISTNRTPHGLIITISKASKPFKRSAKSGTTHVPKVAQQTKSDVPNMSSDVPNSVVRSANVAHVNKEITKTIQDNTNNSTNVLVDRSTNDPSKIFDFYIKQFETPNSKLSTQRRVKIQARLKDAGADMLRRAIENTAKSPFHRGDNDRGWKADIDFIIRSYEQVERLASMHDKQGTVDVEEALRNVKW